MKTMTISTLGILKTDDVKEEWQSEFGNYPCMFTDLFNRVAPKLEFRTYDVTREEHPRPLDSCDAYIITGSKAGVYDDFPWIGSLKKLIRELAQQSIPLAGICFGHQILAAAFGGEVVKSSSGWGVGVHKYQLRKNLNGMEKDSHFSIIATHQDQVIKPPTDSEVLASNDFCPIAGLVSTENGFISFQGHPEFSKDYFLALLERRLHSVGKERGEQARQSMAQKIQPESVAKSILDFLNQQKSA